MPTFYASGACADASMFFQVVARARAKYPATAIMAALSVEKPAAGVMKTTLCKRAAIVRERCSRSLAFADTPPESAMVFTRCSRAARTVFFGDDVSYRLFKGCAEIFTRNCIVHDLGMFLYAMDDGGLETGKRKIIITA